MIPIGGSVAILVRVMLISPNLATTSCFSDEMTRSSCREADRSHEELEGNGPTGTAILVVLEIDPISQLLFTVKLVTSASPQTADKPSKGASAPCNTK